MMTSHRETPSSIPSALNVTPRPRLTFVRVNNSGGSKTKVSTRWDQRLHSAAVKGEVEEIHKVLDTGRVHVDCVDRDGTTPLVLASANGHLECVRELLEQGADPAAKRHTGTSALFFAAQGGFIDILSLLLEQGAPINQPSKDGGTALIVAAQCGHLDIVLELLQKGSDPHMAMRDRATAVFVASQNGHASVVRALLQQGARANVRRIDGSSPLWIASQMGHSSVTKVLLAYGADVNSARHDGATPLFKAAHKGHVDVVREILPHKPKLELLKNGESALHAASLYGHTDVVRLLLNAGADPLLKNEQGLSPLQIAVQAEHSEATSLLRLAAKHRRESSPGHSRGGQGRKSGGSSRNSSLETIVETSPILTRQETNHSAPANNTHFASCELTNPTDAVSVAPSPSPSVVSEPPLSVNKVECSQKPPSQSHSDLRTVKTFFQWTLSSLRRSSLSRKNLRQQKQQ